MVREVTVPPRCYLCSSALSQSSSFYILGRGELWEAGTLVTAVPPAAAHTAWLCGRWAVRLLQEAVFTVTL